MGTCGIAATCVPSDIRVLPLDARAFPLDERGLSLNVRVLPPDKRAIPPGEPLEESVALLADAPTKLPNGTSGFSVPSNTRAFLFDVREPILEECAVPLECAAPLTELAVPLDECVAPLEERVVPLDERAVPLDECVVPLDECAVPLDERAVPLDECVVPLDERAVPLDERAVPLDECAAPLDERAVTLEVLAELSDVQAAFNAQALPIDDRVGPPGELTGPPGERACPPDERVGTLGERVATLGERAGPPGETVGPPDERIGPRGERVENPGERTGPPGEMDGPPDEMIGPPGDRAGPPFEKVGPLGERAGRVGPPGERAGPPCKRLGPRAERAGSVGPPSERTEPPGERAGPLERSEPLEVPTVLLEREVPLIARVVPFDVRSLSAALTKLFEARTLPLDAPVVTFFSGSDILIRLTGALVRLSIRTTMSFGCTARILPSGALATVVNPLSAFTWTISSPSPAQSVSFSHIIGTSSRVTGANTVPGGAMANTSPSSPCTAVATWVSDFTRISSCAPGLQRADLAAGIIVTSVLSEINTFTFVLSEDTFLLSTVRVVLSAKDLRFNL